MALEYVRVGHTPSNGYGNKPFRGSITRLSPLSSVLRILTPEMTQRAPRCKISCLAWARQLSEILNGNSLGIQKQNVVTCTVGACTLQYILL